MRRKGIPRRCCGRSPWCDGLTVIRGTRAVSLRAASCRSAGRYRGAPTVSLLAEVEQAAAGDLGGLGVEEESGDTDRSRIVEAGGDAGWRDGVEAEVQRLAMPESMTTWLASTALSWRR